MKKIILSLVLLLVPVVASAAIDTNLYYGLRNNADVTKLQEFLISKNLLTGSATGNFYSLTLNAVKKYQLSKGINQTGNVGILTRTAINAESSSLTVLTPTTKSQDATASNLQTQINLLQKQLEALNATQNTIQQQNQAIQKNTQQIVENTTPPPVPSPTPAPATSTLPIQINATLYPSNSLAITISDREAICRLVVKDEQGNVYRDQSTWFKDNDNNGRQVVDLNVTLNQQLGKKFIWKVDCSKSGYLDFLKSGEQIAE